MTSRGDDGDAYGRWGIPRRGATSAGGREDAAGASLGGRAPTSGRALTVSAALARANSALQDLGIVCVEGEVVSLKLAASGHAYFSLRDEQSVLPAVMWRSAVQRLRFKLRDGDRIRVWGRLGVFAGSGRFQMYVDKAEPQGLGDVLARLERLKAKLLAEGLFERERKRRLPRWPRVVGIVTSIKGAVLHDIVRVAARRCPTRFLVAPAAVQGADAAADLVRALGELQAIDEVDVVIVARGGGASEDLMAFNDEALVRAIAACRVPVVSAVGHEVDVTLADLVADVRAATPSQAAEIVVADLGAVKRELAGWTRRLESATGRRLLDARAALDARIHRLDRGGRKLVAKQRGRVDLAVTRLERALRRQLQLARARQVEAKAQLERLHPRRRIQEDRRRLQASEARLARSMLAHRQEARERFVALTSKLDALSPLAVLARGYAVVVREDAGLVTDAAALRVGERVDVRVASGRFVAQVVERPGAAATSPRGGGATSTSRESDGHE